MKQKVKRLIIISGGLGILGQSYARGLIEDGFVPVCVDVRPRPEADFVGEYFQCEITNPVAVKALGDAVGSLGGVVHGLINNASCQPEGFGKELEEYSLETFRRVLDVNLAGSFLLTQLVVPMMVLQKSGSIVNIGSIQGVVAPTFKLYENFEITSPLSYAVAKAGLIHFAKWVAARYGHFNIRCNSISPGGVGDSQRGGIAFSTAYADRVPLGRMAHSNEIADAVRFLMGDKSTYITGMNLMLDGGWTAH